jgi:hypothetical protein
VDQRHAVGLQMDLADLTPGVPAGQGIRRVGGDALELDYARGQQTQPIRTAIDRSNVSDVAVHVPSGRVRGKCPCLRECTDLHSHGEGPPHPGERPVPPFTQATTIVPTRRAPSAPSDDVLGSAASAATGQRAAGHQLEFARRPSHRCDQDGRRRAPHPDRSADHPAARPPRHHGPLSGGPIEDMHDKPHEHYTRPRPQRSYPAGYDPDDIKAVFGG